MGRQGRVADQFRERLRAERERREWSQADLSKMLSDKGIHGVYPTTIAKIEAGDRAVRIDELNALADLLGISVDALIGRSPAGGDLVWMASKLTALASKSAGDVQNLSETVADLLTEVRYYAEFDAPDTSVEELTKATETVLSLLDEARQALIALGEVPTPGVTITTRTVDDYERQMMEMAQSPQQEQQ